MHEMGEARYTPPVHATGARSVGYIVIQNPRRRSSHLTFFVPFRSFATCRSLVMGLSVACLRFTQTRGGRKTMGGVETRRSRYSTTPALLDGSRQPIGLCSVIDSIGYGGIRTFLKVIQPQWGTPVGLSTNLAY